MNVLLWLLPSLVATSVAALYVSHRLKSREASSVMYSNYIEAQRRRLQRLDRRSYLLPIDGESVRVFTSLPPQHNGRHRRT